MRRLSIVLTTLFLLSPLTASAAYTTPSEILDAMQTGTPHSFSATAHAASANKMYVSVWANGNLEGNDPTTIKFWTKATVDVVSGDMKVRAKVELMMMDGVLYAKLNSLDGSMKNIFASLSATFRQNVWLKMPLDTDASALLPEHAYFLPTGDIYDADTIFNVTSVSNKKGTLSTLTLKPDAAADLALMIRELLQDTEAVSDDFFPWRALAESVQFEMTLQTDSRGAFVGSSYTMSTKGANSSFALSGTEKPTTALKLTAPSDAIGLEELGTMFTNSMPSHMGMPSTSDMMMDHSVMEPIDMMYEFDSIDSAKAPPDPSCDDSLVDSLKKLMLQRTGACPVIKTPTRYTR